MLIVIFIIAANNINSYVLRNVGVERTNVEYSEDHIVWNLRVFNKVDEVGGVFYTELLFKLLQVVEAGLQN